MQVSLKESIQTVDRMKDSEKCPPHKMKYVNSFLSTIIFRIPLSNIVCLLLFISTVVQKLQGTLSDHLLLLCQFHSDSEVMKEQQYAKKYNEIFH